MSKTILLVHGAWVTTHCWSGFREFFEAQGYTVVVPPWPYMDRPVEALRRTPDPRIAALTIKDLVDHFEKHIRSLPEAPIIIGHSFGGLIVQMLLDRGLGAAGVAIDAGPPRGVLPSPRAIKSALPVLLAWRGWSRILSMSFKGFQQPLRTRLRLQNKGRPTTSRSSQRRGGSTFRLALGLGNAVKFKNSKRPPLVADRRSGRPHEHAFHGASDVSKTSSGSKSDGHP